MARTKRIFREWQHPRDEKGRFAERGTSKWAARAFKAAEASGQLGDAFSMAQPEGPKLGRSTAFVMNRPSLPKARPAAASATSPTGPLSRRTLEGLSDERLRQGIVMNGTNTPKGRQLAAEAANRGISLDTPSVKREGGGMPTTTPEKPASFEDEMDRVQAAINARKAAGTKAPTTAPRKTDLVDLGRKAGVDRPDNRAAQGDLDAANRMYRDGDKVGAVRRLTDAIRDRTADREETRDDQQRDELTQSVRSLERHRNLIRAEMTDSEAIQSADMGITPGSPRDIARRFPDSDVAKAVRARAAADNLGLADEPTEAEVQRSLRALRDQVEAPTIAAEGAGGYASMRRHTLLALARDAGIGVRGKTNTQIANELAARDAKVAADRKAKLNPSGVGVDTPRVNTKNEGMTSTTPEAPAVPNTDHLKRPKARKGDLVVVEETTNDYTIGKGSEERTTVHVGVVTSTDRDGRVTGWSRNADGSYPQKVTNRQKTLKLEAERVDVAAAIAAAQDNPWSHDPSKKGMPFRSVEEARAAVRPHVGDQTEKLKAARAAAPKGRDPMKLKVGDVVTFPAFRQGDPPVTAEIIDAPFAKGDQRSHRVRVKMRVLDGPNAGKEGYHEFKPSERPKVSGSTRGERAMAGLMQNLKTTLDEIDAENAPAPRTPTTNRKQIPRDTKLRAMENQRDGGRGVVARHRALTRAEFDALPEAERTRVLQDLRQVARSKEEESYTIPSNRSSMGMTVRGMREAAHVKAAKDKLRELTYTAPPPVDNSIEGRAARLRAGDIRAIDGATIADLNEIARAAGLAGGNTGWPRTKLVDYIKNQVEAGPERIKAVRSGDLAGALRGATPNQALAVLDARESEYGVTMAEMKAAAKALGIKVTGDKRSIRNGLAKGAGSAAPKAEAAREAAPVSASDAKVETDIRRAYETVANRQDTNGYVSLADLRRELGDTADRATVDRVLDRMIEDPEVRLTAELNQRLLTPADRAAAVTIGGEDRNVIRIGGERTRVPTGPGRPRVGATDAEREAARPRMEGESDFAYSLRTAPGREAARRILNGYDKAGLRAIARDEGVPNQARDTKGDLVNRLLRVLHDRDADARATERMVARAPETGTTSTTPTTPEAARAQRLLDEVKTGKTIFFKANGEWMIIGPSDDLNAGQRVTVRKSDGTTTDVLVREIKSDRTVQGTSARTATFVPAPADSVASRTAVPTGPGTSRTAAGPVDESVLRARYREAADAVAMLDDDVDDRRSRAARQELREARAALEAAGLSVQAPPTRRFGRREAAPEPTLTGAQLLAQRRAGRTEAGTGNALAAAPLRIHKGRLVAAPEGVDQTRAQDMARELEHYRDIGFADLNRDLRIGRTNSTTAARQVAGLDAAMAASPLDRPVVTYRGVAGLPAGLSGAPGDTWQEDAYSSTTVDLSTASGFAGNGRGGTVLRLHVPAGVGGVQLSDAPGPGKPDDREGELLLQRGLTYRVTGVTTVNGTQVLDVEVVPSAPRPFNGPAAARLPARPALPKLRRRQPST